MIDLSLNLPKVYKIGKCYAVHRRYDYTKDGIPNGRPNHLIALFGGDWRERPVEMDIEDIIIHETVHIVLFTLEGEDTGCDYDNICEHVDWRKK